MKKERKVSMNNQINTYRQSGYSAPNALDTYVIPSDGRTNFIFKEKEEYEPTLELLQSILRARKERDSGKSSPAVGAPVGVSPLPFRNHIKPTTISAVASATIA